MYIRFSMYKLLTGILIPIWRMTGWKRLIYINDLPNISKVLNFYLFADDTNISYESYSLQELEKVINKELNKLNLWLNVNRLSLNIDKTNYIIFHPCNKPIKKRITIKINNS